jgi:hypothetical protein
MKYGDSEIQNAGSAWMQRNVMNHKNYITKNKKRTEVESEEIKKELQGTQRSHLSGRGKQQPERLYTIHDEEKQNSEATAAVEMETHRQRSAVCKLKEKSEVHTTR